jgi:hypothetical protein
MVMLKPPSYRANAVIEKTFRFVNTGGTAAEQVFTISAAKLGALMAYCTAANTTVFQLFEQVKVKHVSLWQGPNTNALLPRTVSIQYNGLNLGVTGADQAISDMSVGSSNVAHVHLKPSKFSQASQWQPTQTNVSTVPLFAITCSLGAVIDVKITGVMSSDARVTNNSVAVAAGTLGQLYYLALDNAAGTSLSSANFLTPDPTLITTT